MHRRRLLAALGAAAVPLAGCTGDRRSTTASPTPSPTDETPPDSQTPTDDETPTDATPPANCPTTHGFDVAWPETLDRAAAESFVEAYEAVYYRETVVEYEPNSQLDAYRLDGVVTELSARGDGWTATFSGNGGVYRPTLWLRAATATPPENADVVPATEIEDTLVRDLVTRAADSGKAEDHIDTPGAEVDRYVDSFASLSADFESLSGPGDEDTLYVVVDGTTVELTVQATNFHGDYWWMARYYVDSRVVRRTAAENGDPRGGELLECRRLD